MTEAEILAVLGDKRTKAPPNWYPIDNSDQEHTNCGWSERDSERLIEFYNAGKTLGVIALEMRRGTETLRRRAAILLREGVIEPRKLKPGPKPAAFRKVVYDGY